MTMTKTYTANLASVSESHESGLRGGQATTHSFNLEVRFLGRDRDREVFRLSTSHESGDCEEFLGAEQFVESYLNTHPTKIGCGQDSEGFYVKHERRFNEDVELKDEQISELRQLVEDAFRKTERDIQTPFAGNSAYETIEHYKCLNQEADKLARIYGALSKALEDKAFASNLYFNQ